MIIFIESNTSGSGKKFLEYCHKLTIPYFFLTNNPKKYGWKNNFNYVKCDTNNYKEIHKICNNLINKYKIKIIFSTSDSFITKAYKLSKSFKLNKSKNNFLYNCRKKFILLNLLKRNKFVKREFGIVNFKKKKLNKTIIVKPNSGTGSKNIYKFKSGFELEKKKLDLLQNKDFYIYEEFIKGQEYSLEVFIYKNKIIYKQLIKKETNARFVETGHCASKKIDNLNKKQQDKLLKYLQKLKLDTCFLHIELKFFKNTIEIIEINPRLCGGNISDLIFFSTKLDLIKIFLNLIKKESFTKLELKKKFDKSEYKIKYLIPTENKKIKQINISKSKKILEKKIYRDKLLKYAFIKNNFEDRIGHLIFKNKSDIKINKEYKIIYK